MKSQTSGLNTAYSILLFSLFSFLFVSYAQSADFEFATRIPASQLTCDEEAQALAQKFQDQKITVNKSECRSVVHAKIDGKDEVLYSLALSYHTDKYLMFYSAKYNPIDVDPVFKSDYPYTNYRDCVSDIHHQLSLFALGTGLDPLSASCEQILDLNSYTLTIQAIGLPARRLLALNATYTKAPDMQKIADLLSENDGIPALIVSNSIYYYADPYKTGLVQNSFGKFSNQEECQSQLVDAQTIFAKLNLKSTIGGCSSRSDDSTDFELGLLGVGLANISHDHGDPSHFYYNFTECMQDKVYRLARDTHAYGGICLRDAYRPDRYVLDIYR